MNYARLALAVVALGAFAVTGCQSMNSQVGGLSPQQQGMVAGGQMGADQQMSAADADFGVQQVSYEMADGGCQCASCQAAHGHGACRGCGSPNCNGGCGLRGHLGGHQGNRFCNCGRFSFCALGSAKCWRCGLLRGHQCGRCGVFGVFNGRCGLCGGDFETPHTQPFAGPAGPMSGTYAYPYYTTRGPRDFFMSNPPSLGR